MRPGMGSYTGQGPWPLSSRLNNFILTKESALRYYSFDLQKWVMPPGDPEGMFLWGIYSFRSCQWSISSFFYDAEKVQFHRVVEDIYVVSDFLVGPAPDCQHAHGELRGGHIVGYIGPCHRVVYFAPSRREAVGDVDNALEILRLARLDDGFRHPTQEAVCSPKSSIGLAARTRSQAEWRWVFAHSVYLRLVESIIATGCR